MVFCFFSIWVILLLNVAAAAESRRSEDVRLNTDAPARQSAASFRDCADCPEMVVITEGQFKKGAGEYGNGDPARNVTIKRPFLMARTEITQGQWKAIMGKNPSHFRQCGDNCPVEQVSWYDAQKFIRKLNAKTGKQYRLPSEDEWEYACHGGSKTRYCGGNEVNAVAWNIANSNDSTHPAGQKQANGYGLYDMSGNVWEWMSSCYDASCDERVLGGGSWYLYPDYKHSAARNASDPATRNNDIGFRVARTLP